MTNQILSLIPLIISLLLLLFVFMTLKRNPKNWGVSIGIVWITGLFVCILAALRDGYGFIESSVISFTGYPATLLSLLGISVTVITVSTLFVRNQIYRQKAFIIISLIFLVKLITMEAIRFIALGTL